MFLPDSCAVSVPAYLADLRASDSSSKNRSSCGVKSISFRKLRFFRLNDTEHSSRGSGQRVWQAQNAGSRSIGQVMQWPPPRPLASSNPSMVITSIPALRSAVLVPVLRS